MQTNRPGKSILLAVLIFSIAACTSVRSTFSDPSSTRANYRREGNDPEAYRGWSYLVSRLRDDGISAETLKAIYNSPKMPHYENIPFKLNPAESAASYSQFFQPAKLAKARQFLKTYRGSFDMAEDKYGVPRSVVAAILLIETQLGERLGNELVVNRLSRLASIAEPQNIKWNYENLRKEFKNLDPKRVEARAQYLEDMFSPEIEALIEFCKRSNLDVFEVKGSRAGAFGLPQFIPTSYRKYAVDGNGDGIVSLFREEDAIHSVGNFLDKNGWSSHDKEDQRSALWAYNKSNAYIDAVLKVAKGLR